MKKFKKIFVIFLIFSFLILFFNVKTFAVSADNETSNVSNETSENTSDATDNSEDESLNTSSDVRYGYPHGFGPAGMSYAKDDITKYCSRTSLANSWYTYGYIQGVDSQINYHSTCLAWLVNHNFQLKDYPIKK